MKNFQLFVTVLGILLLAAYLYREPRKTRNVSTTTCKTISGSCKSCQNTGLLPITDPAFNLREVSKQMILLEDHLSNKGKLCHQCIIKHSLTIEGFLEEALCLDSNDQYTSEITSVLEHFRKIEREFVDGVDPTQLAHELREIRKELHVKYFAVGL